ncbi:glycosyltransferase family 39 protein [Candidatus Poribacteria bacterium]|nr:glycosyltransferase family 39 protein [Candidatus Poribacteria bacterium]
MGSLLRRDRFFLILFVVTAFLFWGQRALWESSEGRYGEVGREMAASGQWMIPTIAGHQHLTKPPLTYWFIAAGIKLLGANEWGARLFLSAAFLGTILCVWELAKTIGFTRDESVLSALVFATSAIPFAGGHTLTTDCYLLFWETLGILALWKVWRGAGSLGYSQSASGQSGRSACSQDEARKARAMGAYAPYVTEPETEAQRSIVDNENVLTGSLLLWRLVFWGAFGLAFMTKGPPGWLPLLAVMAYTFLTRGRNNRPRIISARGLALFIAVSFWWYIWIVTQEHDLLRYFLKDEIVNRVLTEEHGRDAPAWMYVPVLFLGVAPWIFAWPEVIRRTRAAWRRGWETLPDWQLFCLLWFAIPFIVFTLAKSRLPLYVLPLFVPVSLLMGRVIAHKHLPAIAATPMRRGLAWTCAIFWAGLMTAYTLAPDSAPGAKSHRTIAREFRRVADEIPGPVRVAFHKSTLRHSIAFYMRRVIEDPDIGTQDFFNMRERLRAEGVRLLCVTADNKLDNLERNGWELNILAQDEEVALLEITGGRAKGE